MRTKITLYVECHNTASNSDWRNNGRFLDRISKGIDGVVVKRYDVGEWDEGEDES